MACCALAMHRAAILRMRRRLAGPMSVAHEPAKVQAVVVRNLSPASPGLMLSNNTVETLPASIGQQVRVLQRTPAKPGRAFSPPAALRPVRRLLLIFGLGLRRAKRLRQRPE